MEGGLPNFYAYVGDTNKYIDVFGLAHGLGTEVIRNGETVFSNTYQSGGVPGGGRLNQQEALLTHTERKFMNEVDGMVQQGDHLKMTGQLNPCKPGCQPAIRDFVANKGVSAEYFASDTNMTYKWEKSSTGKVIQTEIFEGKVQAKYEYDVNTRRRKKLNVH